jgi:hypothetical protein
MKEEIEKILESDRFNMNALYKSVWPLIETDSNFAANLATLKEALSDQDYKLLGNAILRNVFLIEPMMTRGGATKMRVRWLTALENDQRYCSFDDCSEITNDIITELASVWLQQAELLETLTLSLNVRMVSHDICLDYVNLIEKMDKETRIHRRSNLAPISTPAILGTLKLRKILTDPATSPDAAFFKTVLDEKIKVKAYLTDRVQTGEHQTNREKRWETHPHSVHFATRQMAMAIEHKLVTQICAFEDFPEASQRLLQAQGVLPTEIEPFRCPVTLDPISYTKFRKELFDPVHGKSSFQVAHLNPLKLGDPENEASGQMAENISWMSADGNRIQGHLSLNDTRALLQRIAKNYEDLGLVEEDAKPELPQDELA